jgi:salicylate hydroxylase
MIDRVGIVGAGISGLTAGCALRQCGIQVDIYERSKNISEFGAGITLSRNATMLLAKLGVLESLAKKSYKPTKSFIKDYKTAKEITSTNFSGFIAADRRDVVEALSKKYIQLGGSLYTSREVESVDEAEGFIFFSDKSKAQVDLILACDGIRSILRDNNFDNSKPRFTNYVAWRGMSDVKKIPEFDGNDQVNLYLGPGSHAVHYPIGNEGKVNFVAVQRTENWEEESWKTEGNQNHFSEAFSEWNDDVLQIFSAPEKVYRWGIFDRRQPSELYKDKLVLLGDSAHPMVPFLGQGGCVSIEDAYTLGFLVGEFRGDVGKALACYQELRLKRGNWMQRRSNFQGLFNHVTNPMLVNIRNLATKIFLNANVKNLHSFNAHAEVLTLLNKKIT